MADLYINYGRNLAEMTTALMEAAAVGRMLKPNMRVVIKPNLVVARPADGGATTHAEIIEGIIQFLKKEDVRDITIAEGSWVGDSTTRAWSVCGYGALAARYGVKLVDTKKDRCVTRSYGELKLPVCETPAGADFLINVPVLKGHCQTDMTCCLKNMKGCIPDSEKRRYHSMGLHKPIAALNTVLKPQLHIIDSVCGDLTFEEGGNPVESNRIMLGFDPVLLDSYCAQLMGYEPDAVGHLKYAKAYGAGRYADEKTEIVELNADLRPKVSAPRSGQVRRLAEHIDEDSACSACYAALIFALNKTGGAARERIKIGQGFKGKKCPGFGVGNCASGCDKFVPGCPPKATDIAKELYR